MIRIILIRLILVQCDNRVNFFMLLSFNFLLFAMLLSDLFKFRDKPAGEIIQFLQDHGLLARGYISPKCEKEIVFGFDNSISDKYRCRCSK